jgi:methylaspartate mutase epsilon subunit
LLALEQGVRSITLGYGQLGNLVQDVAAIRSLKELADEYFQQRGFTDYELSTVLHQWMGGFPEKETKAYSVITWGGAAAVFSGATKVIIKTPHEAMGIPTREANLHGLESTRQIANMLKDQSFPESTELQTEIELIKEEVRTVINTVLELGEGQVAAGVIRAFEAGVIDIPFSPSIYNAGKLLSVRDNNGMIRIFEKGRVPMAESVFKYHQDKIAERAAEEGRKPCFQMVVDDIYAISKGCLVGRPR